MEKQKNRTVYGRRQSRPLKESQKDLWKNLFPAVNLHLESLPNSYPENVIFEIGFGGGENIAYQAINNLERPSYLCREIKSNQAVLPNCYKQNIHKV